MTEQLNGKRVFTRLGITTTILVVSGFILFIGISESSEVKLFFIDKELGDVNHDINKILSALNRLELQKDIGTYGMHMSGFSESDWDAEAECFIRESEPYSDKEIADNIEWNKNNPDRKVILMKFTISSCGYDWYDNYLTGKAELKNKLNILQEKYSDLQTKRYEVLI